MEKNYKNSLVELVFLGLTPALAATLTLQSALVMAVVVLFILFMSTLTLTLLKKLITKENKLFVALIVTAFYSSISAMIAEAFQMEAFNVMGLYITLCSVNMMIFAFGDFALEKDEKNVLSRAIIFAFVFGIVMCLIGVLRELFGNGTVLGVSTYFSSHKATILQKAPGAFIVASIVMAVVAYIERKTRKEDRA